MRINFSIGYNVGTKKFAVIECVLEHTFIVYESEREQDVMDYINKFFWERSITEKEKKVKVM